MKILSINGIQTAVPVVIADSMLKMTVGLMGEKQGDHALFLPCCRSIHTCFMRYPIDVVCLDEQYKVVSIIPGRKPWRVAIGGKAIRHIVEIPSGRFSTLTIHPGDILGFEEPAP